ncbi:MAG: SDR family NAD(P)-dependent oxidoreductase [Pirellulales bacterium]|nr:SDR family NAD(P)-dependent oxidoreductase [Pirellulales bacterium]
MNLQGQGAVVTGGSTGIGLAIAQALVAAGCKTAIGARRAVAVEQAVATVGDPTKLVGRPLDVADRESVAAFFAWARGELGQIDVLVNSAGVNVRDRRLDVLAPEDWERILQVNVTGAFYCMQEALGPMRERGDGLIVNIVSTAGRRAAPLAGAAYSASKFALAALGTTAALELREQGIRVSSVYPGEVNTPLLDQRPEPVSDEHRARILQPEDVASAVLMISQLPPRAHVPELVIKPTRQAHD